MGNPKDFSLVEFLFKVVKIIFFKKIDPAINIRILFCSIIYHWKDPDLSLKRFWCWEILKAGGEGDDRGWDDWMASLTQWTWVWVNSGSWWGTGRPGVLQSMKLQRVGHDWATELNLSFIMSKNKSKNYIPPSRKFYWVTNVEWWFGVCSVFTYIC